MRTLTKPRRIHFGLPVIVVCLAVSATAFGGSEDKELARKHFKAGMSLLDTGNYEVAADEFKSSIKLYPTKNGYFNLAVCYFELDKMSDALMIIYDLKKAFSDKLDETWTKEIDTFEKKLVNAIVPVEFRANIENITIKLDGKEIHSVQGNDATHYIDPGEHTVTLSAEGYKTITEKIRLNPGQGRTVLQFVMVRLTGDESESAGNDEETLEQNTTHPVHFKNDKDGKKKKKRKRVGTIVAFSIGGAAGAAAITTGIIHLVNLSKVRDICNGDICTDTTLKGSVDTIQKIGVATNVLISVAAVSIVTGTILAFVEGKSKKKERRVSLAPTAWREGGGLMLSGEF